MSEHLGGPASENAALEKVVGLIRERSAQRPASAQERRRQADRNADVFSVPVGCAVHEATLGGYPVEWAQPEGLTAAPVVLYFHGGGYTSGSYRSHRHMTARLALAAGARVASVDYPLAPESPFAAAPEAALACYKALLAEGVAPDRIAFGGDSAGGGLAIAALLAAKEHALPMPAAAICLSPWADLMCATETYQSRAAADPMITQAAIAETASVYLAGTDAKNPLASPVYGDLSGLPPLFIQVGDAEVLLDDARLLAQAVKAHNGRVDIEIWPEMFHVWQLFYQMLPQGERALVRLGEYLRAQLE